MRMKIDHIRYPARAATPGTSTVRASYVHPLANLRTARMRQPALQLYRQVWVVPKRVQRQESIYQ